MWGLDALGQGLASLGGGPVGREARRERRHQEEFAQNSLLWKADQLRQLGINPVAMAGISGDSYRPQQVGGTANIGRGLGQLANNLIRRSIDADTKWKNAAAEAMKKTAATGTVSSVSSTGAVEMKPGESVSSTVLNKGLEAGAKTGDVATVLSDNSIKIHANEMLSEALESQGMVDKGIDNLNRAITTFNIGINKKGIRTKLRKAVIESLRSTGKLNPGETIYWNGFRQRFVKGKLRSLKHYSRSRTLRRIKTKLNKKRKYWNDRPFGDIGS